MIQKQRSTPSFTGLRSASKRASGAARAASKKADTRCELALRRELWGRGLRYRLHVAGLPGRPDVVFCRERVVVFCDGDFWHGRDLERRLENLSRGHNPTYWVAKAQRNVARDHENNRALEAAGWTVVRVWETDVLHAPARVADRIVKILLSARLIMLTNDVTKASRWRAAVAAGAASRDGLGKPDAHLGRDPAHKSGPNSDNGTT